MDSELERYLKEIISFFEDDGGASYGSDDTLWIDESDCLTDEDVQNINSFNQKRENPLELIVNKGKSDLGDYK